MGAVCKLTVVASLLLMSCAVIANDRMAEVTAQFERQNYQEVIHRLKDQPLETADAARLLGLALYRLPDPRAAVPALQRAHQLNPGDPEVLFALADSLRAAGELNEASRAAERLADTGAAQGGRFIFGAIAEDRGQHDQAMDHYRAAMAGPDRRLAQQAARALTDLLHRRGDHEQAATVAMAAVDRALDPLTAAHLGSMEPTLPPPARPLNLRLGYRLEYDDNVPQVPGDAGLFGVTEDSGFRHVLTGDLAWQRALGSNLSLFTEAYLYQSLHQDSDLQDFNFTRVSGLAGLGGSWERGGWRVPVEVAWEGLDGSRYRTSISALPGVYFQPRENWLVHAFARLTHSDFASPIRPSEDQGGDSWRLGLFLHAQPMASLNWRLIAEYGEDDADGNNWALEEWRVYSLVEYRFSPRFSGGLGLQYRDRDFDNLHDVFLVRRSDEVFDVFVNLSWHLSEQWRIRAQYSYQEQDSSIGLYEFDRNVFSVGLSWEF